GTRSADRIERSMFGPARTTSWNPAAGQIRGRGAQGAGAKDSLRRGIYPASAARNEPAVAQHPALPSTSPTRGHRWSSEGNGRFFDVLSSTQLGKGKKPA